MTVSVIAAPASENIIHRIPRNTAIWIAGNRHADIIGIGIRRMRCNLIVIGMRQSSCTKNPTVVYVLPSVTVVLLGQSCGWCERNARRSEDPAGVRKSLNWLSVFSCTSVVPQVSSC